jgi:hypothetical protein
MSKLFLSLVAVRAEKGNLVTSTGSIVILLSLTLPFLLKGRGSFITAFEYLYTFIISGEGYILMSGAVIAVVITSISALLIGSSKIISFISIITALLFACALFFSPIPLNHIGFGSYLIIAGLLVTAAGAKR